MRHRSKSGTNILKWYHGFVPSLGERCGRGWRSGCIWCSSWVALKEGDIPCWKENELVELPLESESLRLEETSCCWYKPVGPGWCLLAFGRPDIGTKLWCGAEATGSVGVLILSLHVSETLPSWVLQKSEKKVETFPSKLETQCVSLLAEQINPDTLENVKSSTLKSAVLGLRWC